MCTPHARVDSDERTACLLIDYLTIGALVACMYMENFKGTKMQKNCMQIWAQIVMILNSLCQIWWIMVWWSCSITRWLAISPYALLLATVHANYDCWECHSSHLKLTSKFTNNRHGGEMKNVDENTV